MFSKLRKNKTSKPTQSSSKLGGMPELKQMRSSKREETLKAKLLLTSLSELEKQAMTKGKEATSPTREEMDQHKSQHIVITPNYKRSTSPDSGHYSSGSRQVDRITPANGSTFVFYGETSPGITEDIPETKGEFEETKDVDSPWRISKGDSGYKSKDDENFSSKNKKHKRSRKKSNGRPNNCGLHQVKQQRKASREGVSMSMRALTPKERESIQCLEDVLKDHPDGDESPDEVFDSDTGQDVEDETELIIMEEKECVETIDHGYASVNDVSRRYSVESIESVGSIIDLVGNLSTSSPLRTPPVNNAVEASEISNDLTQVPSDDVFQDEFSNVNLNEEDVQCKDKPLVSGGTILSDEALSHLDGVNHSFTFQSELEENSVDNLEARDMVSCQVPVSNEEAVMRERECGKEEQKDRSHGERKKKKKAKRRKSRDSVSDTEKEKRQREGHKERDLETEKERKERKKQRKEEKRKKRKEILESEDELRRREEHIARHVDEISTLTQNMIITAQKNIEAEPIYAQVTKAKKKKDINGNLKFEDMKPLEEVVPDPPSPFANPTLEEIELEREKIMDKSHEMHDFSEFYLTSTPVSSINERETAKTSMQDVTKTRRTPVTNRPASDSSHYTNDAPQHISGSNSQLPGRLLISPRLLEDSSQKLKPVTPHGLHVFQIDPCRNSVKRGILETASPPSAFKDQPMSKMDSDRSSLPSKQEKVHRRPPRVTANVQIGRPMSLNLEENTKVGFLGEERREIPPKHSSFREKKTTVDKGQKPRPFVIQTSKKPIQLC